MKAEREMPNLAYVGYTWPIQWFPFDPYPSICNKFLKKKKKREHIALVLFEV